jgi:hypothetical protein
MMFLMQLFGAALEEDAYKKVLDAGLLGALLLIAVLLLIKLFIDTSNKNEKREDALNKEINELNKFVSSTLLDVIRNQSELIAKCTQALGDSADAMSTMTLGLQELKHELSILKKEVGLRPCLLPNNVIEKIKEHEK